MKIVGAGGLILQTGQDPFCGNTPWFAYVMTDGYAWGTVGSAARCQSEREAIEDAFEDAERNLKALADKAREAQGHDDRP